MNVLVACEYSGIVRDAFTSKGHDAWSCDILPTESPGNHFQGDILEHLRNDYFDEDMRCHNFKSMSCEMIARELYEGFDLEYCSVFEDNENGAEIYE